MRPVKKMEQRREEQTQGEEKQDGYLLWYSPNRP